jgi:hypothetical protein
VRLAAFIFASLAAIAPARAQEATEATPVYSRPGLVTTFAGLGGSPTDKYPNAVLTIEIAHRPFGGALTTGISLSSATELDGTWNVITPGLVAKMDLTYVALSGFFSHDPKPDFPIRFHVGARVGMAVSQSWVHIEPSTTSSYELKSSYVLVRPELESFLDVEVPFGKKRAYSLVGRVAFDTPIAGDTLFRWSLACGLGYSWGTP